MCVCGIVVVMDVTKQRFLRTGCSRSTGFWEVVVDEGRRDCRCVGKMMGVGGRRWTRARDVGCNEGDERSSRLSLCDADDGEESMDGGVVRTKD